MQKAQPSLPDDVNSLKHIVSEQQVLINALTEQVRLLKHHRYGASSEKTSPDQLLLFNEAECEAAVVEDEPSTTVAAHSRRRGHRKTLSKDLPRIDVTHDLSCEEKICECGHEKSCIGEETSEQLEIIPAQIRVIRNVFPKYVCNHCNDAGVQRAKPPLSPIPRSNVTPGLLAYIIISKFMDALPLYRQEKIFDRLGATISRTTMARWIISVLSLVQPLLNLMADSAKSYDILGIDETPVQVLKEPGKTPQSASYMFVRQGGPPDKQVILFDYSPSKAQPVVNQLLEDFNGYLQSDGYAGYSSYSSVHESVTSLGCWAHARRKFKEATIAQGKKTGAAMQGLSYINALYRIEHELDASATAEQRYDIRQSKTLPLLEKIRAWLDKSLLRVPGKTKVGTALNYLHNQWHTLIVYVNDGRLRIDNNLTENAIRPFVIGRNNWIFSDTTNGAKASAGFYSLIETAKANGLEPYRYIRYLFQELPKVKSIEEYEALLPWNVDKDFINSNSIRK
jgi:transposase